MTPPDAATPTLSPDFLRFHRHVQENPALLDSIRSIRGPERFKKAVVELGAAHGFIFTGEDVALALENTRRTWLERRIG